MSKKIISTLLVVLLLFVAFAACAPSENTESAVGSSSAESSAAQESSKPSTGTSSKIVIDTDVIYALSQVEDLIKECPVIVRGKVAKKDKAIEVIAPIDADHTSTSVRTYFVIEVSEVFKGGQKHAEKTLFWEFGGETENMIQIVTGIPEMAEIGEERIFFIHAGGSAYSKGFFANEENKIMVWKTELPEAFKNDAENVGVKMISMDEFAEILRDKIAEVNAQKKQ